MKKKVMQFFAVLVVFVGVLAILQYFVFGGITFFAIYNSENSVSINNNSEVENFLNQVNSVKGFSIKINDYTISNGKLEIQYAIKELKGENQEMVVTFSFFDNNQLIEKGEQKIVVEANSNNIYSIVFSLPEGYSNLAVLLEANNGRTVASTSKEISSGKINAYAIRDVKAEAIPWLLFIVIALAIVVVVLRSVTKKQTIHYFRRKHSNGLIGLEVQTP